MEDPGSNRKLYFGRDITAKGASSTIGDDGVTLSFRTRVATSGLLDDAYPDGGGGWQQDGGAVAFSLAVPSDVPDEPGGGLLMNNLNGNSITRDVDFLSWTSGVVAPVPEPGTLTLLLLAVLSSRLLVWRRRRAM